MPHKNRQIVWTFHRRICDLQDIGKVYGHSNLEPVVILRQVPAKPMKECMDNLIRIRFVDVRRQYFQLVGQGSSYAESFLNFSA